MFGGPLREDMAGWVALALPLNHTQKETSQLQKDFITALATAPLTCPFAAYAW